MATYYWVGGSGNWDATSTTNWASSSGGSGGAGVPTSADDVIFDAGSNVGTGTFTVTVTGTSSAPSICNDFSTGGAGGALDGAMTLSLGATAVLDCYGSLTLPATNFTWSGTNGAILSFRSTSLGKTITTNGVSITLTILQFNGVGGEWTLGSALTLTANASASIDLLRGTFRTGNYNITSTAGAIRLNATGDARAMYLGSSTITLANTTAVWNTQLPTTNLTFDAGTSTITTATASPIFNGSGLTFYNVSFTSAASGGTTINGANTFNNLTQTSRSADGIRILALGANQTINGTLTLGSANTAVRRIIVQSDTVGTQRTITLNGTLATLADVDFRDINAAGLVATPWTGTRLGNALNNSNITFDAPKTVYWNLAGSQNWSATAWATTNNGTPAANNFPLPQDTATFTEAGAAGTVTYNANFFIGSIQMADGVSNRTTAFTLATGTNVPPIHGNVTLFSNLTLTGTGVIQFQGQGTTQTVTSAGKTFTQPITINSPSGTVQLQDNLTMDSTRTFTLTAGTLDLTGNSGNWTLSAGFFSSVNSNVRAIFFGTGQIDVTGNGSSVWSTNTSTNFSYTGTSKINCTYSGATGTRSIFGGDITLGGTAANALNFNITAGTDTVTFGTNNRVYKDVNFTGFSGTLANGAPFIYGNYTLSSGMTLTAGANATTFAATTSGNTITCAGKTLDFPVTFNGINGVWTCQDALTLGSTRVLTLTNGTLNLKNGVTSTVGSFVTSGSNQKYLGSSTVGSQATLSDASGTNDVSYLTIQDTNATGGATWNAFVNQQNVDAGNNDGWDFGISPIVGSYEYTYQLRSFTQPRRF